MEYQDIIGDASAALGKISSRGIPVMQGWYDDDIKECHITLWDLGGEESNYSDDEAEGITFSVQVTIFSTKDETKLSKEVKTLMKRHGFDFDEKYEDDSQPEDGIYMKAQRFSKYYEYETEETDNE